MNTFKVHRQALIISEDSQMKHCKNLKNDIPSVALELGFLTADEQAAVARHSHNKKPLYCSYKLTPFVT